MATSSFLISYFFSCLGYALVGTSFFTMTGLICFWIVGTPGFLAVDLLTVAYLGFNWAETLVFLVGAGELSFIPVIWSPFMAQ